MLAGEHLMRICYAALYYDSDHADDPPAAALDRVPLLRHLPRALAARGHQVTLVHLYPRSSSFAEDGVSYRFVRPPRWARWTAAAAHRLAGIERARGEPATSAIREIFSWRPDVVHLFGTNLTLNSRLLFQAAAGAATPVVVAHHGGDPPSDRLRRAVLSYSLSRAAALLFTTADHARPWLKRRLIDPNNTPISEVMEVSTSFRHRDREQARAETEMTGDPVFVWAGRLEPVKDPLTALRGFDRIRAAWSGARLYLYYLTEHLMPEIRAFLDSRPGLADHLCFRGRVPHDAMEAVFNSADLLVQASRPLSPGHIAEYSGYVPLEAMACGVAPVLSDIPSFRIMTDEGRVGVLFPSGDDAALASGVLALTPRQISDLGNAARHRFEREFSFSAIARTLEAVYERALRRSPVALQ
jgi:glycosyltransferase involved in cell wall biosynthesis